MTTPGNPNPDATVDYDRELITVGWVDIILGFAGDWSDLLPFSDLCHLFFTLRCSNFYLVYFFVVIRVFVGVKVSIGSFNMLLQGAQ